VPHAKKHSAIMKIKIYRFAILILLLSSCVSKTTLKFEISNHSNELIDSLRLIPSGYESDYYISIAPKKTVEYILDMTDIAKVDGDYQIDYKFNSKNYNTKTFGYYTNGYPIESLIRVNIKPDTIMFDSELNRY